MKKKLTFIFILIIFSIVGIIYFQVDWMNKSYQIYIKKLSSDADILLIKALKEHASDRRDSVGKRLIPYFSRLYSSVAIGFSENSDSLKITFQEKNIKLVPIGKVQSQMSFGIGKVSVFFPFRSFSDNKIGVQENDRKAEKILHELFPVENDCSPLYYKSEALKLRVILKKLCMRLVWKNLTTIFNWCFSVLLIKWISLLYLP